MLSAASVCDLDRVPLPIPNTRQRGLSAHPTSSLYRWEMGKAQLGQGRLKCHVLLEALPYSLTHPPALPIKSSPALSTSYDPTAKSLWGPQSLCLADFIPA